MQDHTSESIKSLEGYRIAELEEAQSLSQRSLDILRPTMRGGAEIWASWNPQSPEDPIDALLRGPNPPPRSILVEANWQDNPWFPDDLREEMEFDRSTDPDKFAWVWGGGYEPRSGPGRYFKEEWFIPVEKTPPRDSIRVYGGSDYAVTDDGGDYTVHVVIGLDADDNPWILDVWREQASSNVWVSSFCDLVIKWKPMAWAEEHGQIKSGVGPFLTREMRERKAYTSREQFPTRGDKAVRAQSFRGMAATRGIRIPSKAPWRTAFENELLRFPGGVHDDQVDACLAEGTFVRMADGLQRPIEGVRVGDMVATPIGACEVLVSAVTNEAAVVYRVETTCGRALVATGNHPVHVEGKGFVRVDALCMMDQITLEPSCYEDRQRPRSLNIWAIAIGGIQKASLARIGDISTGLSQGEASFTGIFGRMPTGRSRPDTTSITSTSIRPIMTLRTWLASPSRSTGDIIRSLANLWTSNSFILNASVRKPPLGILRKREVAGTARLGSGLGKIVRRFGRHARLVALALKRSISGPCFVPAHANSAALVAALESEVDSSRMARLSFASAVTGPSSQNGQTTRPTAQKPAGCVIAVEALSAPVRVRNLTVSHAHVFYANGLLTHNCGLVGQLLDMMASGPKPPQPEKKRIDDYSSSYASDRSDFDPLTI